MKKGQFATQVVTKALFKEFKKKHPEYKDMTWDQFFGYWKDIAETIREEVTHNPLGVKLGSYTGEIKLQYLPHKFKGAFNWDPKVTAEADAPVRHLSILQKGKHGKIKWERRWAVKFNKMLQFYAFEAGRELELMARDKFNSSPESIRMARNTLGGHSVWRQLK